MNAPLKTATPRANGALHERTGLAPRTPATPNVQDALAVVFAALRPLIVDAAREAVAELGPTTRPALLSREKLALELDVCPKTIGRLEREGLPYVPVGTGAKRYELERVLEWLRDRERDE